MVIANVLVLGLQGIFLRNDLPASLDLPIVGVFTNQFKEKYCWCRFAKTPTMAKLDWWGLQPRTKYVVNFRVLLFLNKETRPYVYIRLFVFFLGIYLKLKLSTVGYTSTSLLTTNGYSSF